VTLTSNGQGQWTANYNGSPDLILAVMGLGMAAVTVAAGAGILAGLGGPDEIVAAGGTIYGAVINSNAALYLGSVAETYPIVTGTIIALVSEKTKWQPFPGENFTSLPLVNEAVDKATVVIKIVKGILDSVDSGNESGQINSSSMYSGGSQNLVQGVTYTPPAVVSLSTIHSIQIPQ
jgi:hypothetical protein